MAPVVMDVAVAVTIVAAIATAAEYRAGPSCDCAYRAADDRSDGSADRSPGGDASEGADRLCGAGAGTECEAGQRHANNLVHDRSSPTLMFGNIQKRNLFHHSRRCVEAV